MTNASWLIRADWPEPDPTHNIVFWVTVGDFKVPWFFDATVKVDAGKDSAPDRPSGEWPPIRMHIQMQGSRPIVRHLTVGETPESPLIMTGEDRARMNSEELDELWAESRSQGAQPAITATLLRELPLARLAKYAMLGVAIRLGEGPAAEWVVPRDFRDDDGFYRVGPGEIDVEEYYGVYFGGTDPAWQELWSEQMQALAVHAERASRANRRNRVTDELLNEVADVYRQAIVDRRPPKKAVQEAWHVSEATAGRYIMRARKRGFLGKTVRGKKGEISQ